MSTRKKTTSKGVNSIRGFLAGSLIIASLINSFNIFGQIVLFIIGLLVILDCIMLHGRDTHILTTLFFAVIGGAVAILLTLFGYGIVYLTVIGVIVFLVYVYRFIIMKGVVGQPEKSKEEPEMEKGDKVEIVDL